ncbi:MAG: sodium-translocating pyrophosphatase [Candidatus Korarchaeum sp.]
MKVLWEVIIAASTVSGILIALLLRYVIARMNPGNERMVRISQAIRRGSKAYLHRQYKVILSVMIVIGAFVYILDLIQNGGIPYVSASFMLGTIASLLAGYVSMDAATITNTRVAQAARESKERPLVVAYLGGLVLGLMVVSMSLAGVAGMFFLYWWLNGWSGVERIPTLVMGFGFGASLAALFAQLGGGIYTKAADVGADLVGKVEAGIPEDDPRNPAVIADNVGDNVGDCAGRGADLFESISAENIGSMIIGAALYLLTGNIYFIFFPLVARAMGIVGTLVGSLFIKPRGGEMPVAAMRRALIASVITTAVLFYFITSWFGKGHEYLYLASLLGMAAALIIELAIEYYTEAHRPVLEIVRSTETGPATTILSGLSVGMEAPAIPVISVLAALGASYYLGGVYGQLNGIPAHFAGIYGTVAATIGMLSLTGIILAMDGYGPIADNASGIIEMAGIEEEVGSEVKDILDAAGNTTKSLAKGFAMGSAAMASLLLFQAYVDVVRIEDFNLMQPVTLVGLLAGAILPFFFSSRAIRAVGNTAWEMIREVRRQFREIPGILEGKNEPDYARCVDISTRAAQKEMIVPSLVSLVAPIVVGILLGPVSLGGFQIGVTAAGVMLAFLMNTGGAAWDNAKKYIERSGRKGTEEHKASVIGDTVGDPLKDTAGPSLHVLLKLVNNVSIVMGSAIVLYSLYLLG